MHACARGVGAGVGGLGQSQVERGRQHTRTRGHTQIKRKDKIQCTHACVCRQRIETKQRRERKGQTRRGPLPPSPSPLPSPMPLSNHRPPTGTTTACTTKTPANKHVWEKKWAAEGEREDKTPFGESSRLERAWRRGSVLTAACLSLSRLQVFCFRRQEAGGWLGQGRAGICVGRAGRRAGRVYLCMWVLGDVVVVCCVHPRFFLSFVPEGKPNTTMITFFCSPLSLSLPPTTFASLP